MGVTSAGRGRKARDGGGGGETRHATCALGSSRRTSSQGKFRGLSLPDSLGERGERLEERLRALALRARHREDASRDHDSDARGGLGATEKGDTHATPIFAKFFFNHTATDWTTLKSFRARKPLPQKISPPHASARTRHIMSFVSGSEMTAFSAFGLLNKPPRAIATGAPYAVKLLGS